MFHAFFRFFVVLGAAQSIDHHSAGGSNLLSPLTASGFLSTIGNEKNLFLFSTNLLNYSK